MCGLSAIVSVWRWVSTLCRAIWTMIACMENSELVADTLGEHVFDFFLRNKRAEFDKYRRQLTPIEDRKSVV